MHIYNFKVQTSVILDLIETIESGELFEDFLLRGFSNFSSQKRFVDNRVHFVKIENQVQFANVVKVFVQNLKSNN